MTEKIVVVAGIPPGKSGTGRMIRQMMTKSKRSPVRLDFIYRARPKKPIRALVKNKQWRKLYPVAAEYFWGNFLFYLKLAFAFLSGRGKLLIMHPQTLGFALTRWLIWRWPAGKIYLYVLNSSYFCIRSYNYIPNETGPCLRCQGGAFEQREVMGCQPFPVRDPESASYVRVLFDAVRSGRVKLMAQNERQSRHISGHFGENTQVPVVGLWGEEWTTPFDAWESRQSEPDFFSKRSGPIIIHSFYVEAKGAVWFIELARHCPDLQFFCPFSKAKAIRDAPPNISFKLLTWENGLKATLEEASVVMVPSLWSAPIEGALVKSLITNPFTMFVDNPTAFQNELPEEIALRLSGDPKIAADQLRKALREGWAPDAGAHRRWVRQFRSFNEGFFDNILAHMVSTKAARLR